MITIRTRIQVLSELGLSDIVSEVDVTVELEGIHDEDVAESLARVMQQAADKALAGALA